MTQTHELSATKLREHLEAIRKSHGEEAYEKAKIDFAVALIAKPNGDLFLKNAFPDLDLGAVRAQAEARSQAQAVPTDPTRVMVDVMRQQIPNLKTQAQLNAFMTTFEALRHTMNAAFGRSKAEFDQYREVLDKALDAAWSISGIVETLSENPEAATSADAKQFKDPPLEFMEFDAQRALLSELADIRDLPALNHWYKSNGERINSVVSPDLRNPLLDAIRTKKHTLEQV